MASHFEQGAALAAPVFDPAQWLDGFAAAGGGYTLGSDRRLYFNVATGACDIAAVASALTVITVEPAHMEAVRRAIEARQGMEVRHG